MKITVLGCGRWGSFLAWYSAGLGYDVCLWGREQSGKYQQLLENKKNEYLSLQENVSLTHSLEDALNHSDIVIISISAQELRKLAGEIIKCNHMGKSFILGMKGLETSTGMRLTEVFNEVTNNTTETSIWVGPGHVQDFVRSIPNCMVIDSAKQTTSKRIAELFSSELIRFYYGHDLVGNEIGAAAKNVMGIAAGMLDGLNQSSLKGALMARGAHEISRLIESMGGQKLTAYGLSHLGDYEATLFSPHSNNRRFGEIFVSGKKFEKLAEGVSSAKAIMLLANKYKTELPICHTVYSIIFENYDTKEALRNLFLRSIKSEFDSPQAP